jgi:hypothetical protein
MMPVMPFETVPGSDLHGLRIAASKTAWGLLSAAGVLILARAVFGELRGPGLADTAAALAGAVIAGGVQFSLYRWLVERQGFYGELGLLYRWINEPALIVAASTSLFAIAVRPRDSTPPRVALALSVIAGIALALTNLRGARDGISLVGLWLAAAVSLATLYFVVAAAWAIKGQSAPS